MTPAIRNMTSVYFVENEKILCLFRIGSRIADKMYVGAAGGHFKEGEMKSPEACIRREIKEEMNLDENDIADLRLRYITHRLKDGEIRSNFYFFARLRTILPLKSTEGRLKWIQADEFKDLSMPVSAKHMMMHYLKEGKNTTHLYAGITEEEGTNFTVMKEF